MIIPWKQKKTMSKSMWSKILIIFVIFLLIGIYFSIFDLNFVSADTSSANPPIGGPGSPFPESDCLPGLMELGGPNNPGCHRKDFVSFLKWLFPFMLSAAAILAVLMIVIAGARWVASAGSEAEIKAARDMITNAILGLILAFAAWLIIQTINPDILKGLL